VSRPPTGLAEFTRRSGLQPARAPHSARDSAPDPAALSNEPDLSTGRPKRARASQQRPTVPFRMSRRTWERVHELAVSEGISIQHLLFTELSLGFKRRGLPPLEE
jgi:hypothetical protein